jgi:hypothetical protein
MRILKSLEEKTKRAKTRGAKAHTYNDGEERPGEGAGIGWKECDESMAQGSMVFDYCQGLLLKQYHSNETGGSRALRGCRDCEGLVGLWKGVEKLKLRNE